MAAGALADCLFFEVHFGSPSLDSATLHLDSSAETPMGSTPPNPPYPAGDLMTVVGDPCAAATAAARAAQEAEIRCSPVEEVSDSVACAREASVPLSRSTAFAPVAKHSVPSAQTESHFVAFARVAIRFVASVPAAKRSAASALAAERRSLAWAVAVAKLAPWIGSSVP